MLALFMVFRPQYPGGSETLDRWLDLGGLSLMLLGQALRVAVIGYAYIIRGGKNKRPYAEGLVTRGLYAHCRNPLYVGNVLIFAGLFILFNNLWVYILGSVFFLFMYRATVAAEENYLRDRYGAEYEAYCRRVPRWIPNFRGLGDTVRGMSFQWRRVIVYEYESTFAWVAGALVVLMYDMLAHFRYQDRQGPLNTLAVLLVAAFIIRAVVRHLVRSERLRPD